VQSVHPVWTPLLTLPIFSTVDGKLETLGSCRTDSLAGKLSAGCANRHQFREVQSGRRTGTFYGGCPFALPTSLGTKQAPSGILLRAAFHWGNDLRKTDGRDLIVQVTSLDAGENNDSYAGAALFELPLAT
jgi:hypothetical protein